MSEVADNIPETKPEVKLDKTETKPEDTSWKDSLGDDLKDASELKNFKDVNNLAKSYIQLSKLTSQKHEGISEEDSWDEFSTKAKNFFKLKEDEKEYDFEVKTEDTKSKDFYRKLGFDLNLHPMQAKALFQKIQDNKETTSKDNLEHLKSKWTKETKESVFKDISNKDEIIGKALKSLEMSSEELSEKLGVAAHHPIINKMLKIIGTKTEEGEGTPITTETKAKQETDEYKDMESFVKQALESVEGPYYDEKSPSHLGIKQKVDKYIATLQKAQDKGHKFNIM